jgi:Trk K+ transport system NAD-binding subunit
MTSEQLGDRTWPIQVQAIATMFSNKFNQAGIEARFNYDGGRNGYLHLLLTGDQAAPDQNLCRELVTAVLQARELEVSLPAPPELAQIELPQIELFGYGQADLLPAWRSLLNNTPLSLASLNKLPARVSSTQVDSSTAPNSFALDQLNQLEQLELADQAEFNHASDNQRNDQQLSLLLDRNGDANSQTDYFLVCGLGNLGQQCVVNLKKFAWRGGEIRVTAIDQAESHNWEIDRFPELLDRLVIGDCRKDSVLRKANISQFRAILFVASDEGMNIEAAIAARRLNPTACLVVRSSRHNLNHLLQQQLGNFVALDPAELPAAAFTVAGLGKNTLGFFKIGDRRFRVVEQQVKPKDYRFDNFPATMLHRKDHRLLSLIDRTIPAQQLPDPALRSFYQWQPDTRVKAGDTVVYIEAVDQFSGYREGLTGAESRPKPINKNIWQQLWRFMHGNWYQRLQQLWQWFSEHRTRLIVALGIVVGFLLWAIGSLTLKFNVESLTWQKAMSNGVILLLGGYGDVFGGLDEDPVPGWVKLVCFLITLLSLLFVLGVLGLVADRVISSRFDLWLRRPPVPKRDHVVLVGLGRVGSRVATLLQQFQQPLVGITTNLENPRLLPQTPLLVGNIIRELARANLATAKSLIVVTDDQMLNLEVALIAKEAQFMADRQINAVVRTYDQEFGDKLQEILPGARALCAYALSAQAFAGAALGENILSLFRLSFNNRTILVTEFTIEPGDQLIGKILAEVAYGYGVVPIYYQKDWQNSADEPTEFMMPSDDKRLRVGDHLVVLASIDGLRRIERRQLVPPRRWRLWANAPLAPALTLGAGNTLANVSGCSLSRARKFIDHLPGHIELDLYDYQAQRLLQQLSKQLPSLRLVAID